MAVEYFWKSGGWVKECCGSGVLAVFFKRRGKQLALKKSLEGCRPGDLVTCIVPYNRPHIMVVSDTMGAEGRPRIIHNIGQGAREVDELVIYPPTGHFRWA